MQHDAVLVDDADVEVGNQDQDAASTMCPADTDVEQPRAVAKRDRSDLVDDVVANIGRSEDQLTVELRSGLVEGPPGLQCRTSSGGVGASFVVVRDEAVDPGLQLGNRR